MVKKKKKKQVLKACPNPGNLKRLAKATTKSRNRSHFIEFQQMVQESPLGWQMTISNLTKTAENSPNE